MVVVAAVVVVVEDDVTALVVVPLGMRTTGLPSVCETAGGIGLPGSFAGGAAFDELTVARVARTVASTTPEPARMTIALDCMASWSGGGAISVDDILPATMQPKRANESGRTLADVVDAAERQAIEAALRECDGSRERAAEMLGISATTLWRKMTRLAITYPPA